MGTEISERVVLSKSNVNTISFAIGIPMGSALETHHGASSVLSSHLSRATEKYDENQLANLLDDLGISMMSSVSRTGFTLGMNVPPKNLEKAIDIYKEILLNPQFDEAITMRIVQQEKGGLQQIRSTPNSIMMNYTLYRAAFGDDPITRHPSGTEESLDSINPEILSDWHKDLLSYQPKFVSVGLDINEKMIMDAGMGEILDQFGNRTVVGLKIHPPQNKLRVELDKTDAPASNAYIALNMRSFSTKDSKYQDSLFNSILSGGFSSRMFTKIRDDKNLSYGPFSMNSRFSESGLITASMDVRPDRSVEALDTTVEIFQDVFDKPIESDELKRALKTALAVSVFVSDSSRAYTSFIISRLMKNEEWLLSRIKEDMLSISQSGWQADMKEFWRPENISLAVTGDGGDISDVFVEKMEAVL